MSSGTYSSMVKNAKKHAKAAHPHVVFQPQVHLLTFNGAAQTVPTPQQLADDDSSATGGAPALQENAQDDDSSASGGGLFPSLPGGSLPQNGENAASSSDGATSKGKKL